MSDVWESEGGRVADPRRRVAVNGAPYGTISWEEHLQAYDGYARKFPGSASAQDAERIAARGGFSVAELVYALGHMPLSWQPGAATKLW